MNLYFITLRHCCAVLLVHFLLSCALLCSVSLASDLNRSVLYINSYHNGYRWSDGILEGLRTQFEQSPYKIDLQIEYMDGKKFTDNAIFADLLALYEKKFSTESFDTVVVSDDIAFNFAINHRDALFPGVPIVFCGVNSLTEQDLAVGNITGIVESFDFQRTIDIALKLHPEKKRMMVVGDASITSMAIRHQIEELLPRYRGRLQIKYWTNLGLEEVQQRVGTLPDDTFLFVMPYYHVLGDLFYTAEEVVAAIYKHSSVPIYSSWEFLVGHGVVGGSVISGRQHGERAAEMVLDTLEEKNTDLIPVRWEVQGTYEFDYEVMKRLGISPESLPEESIIVNAPSPFYEVSREVFWVIIIAVCILLVTVCFLGLNIIARREGEMRIKNQLAFQEILIDTVPQLVSWKDIHGSYMGGNSSYADFFGLGEKAKVINEKTKNIIPDPEYARWSIGADQEVIKDQVEFRRVRKKITDNSGSTYWLEVNKVPLRNEKGKVSGVLTTAEDVTRAQDLENQLFQSQKMKAVGTLAGGIAHDFNNILTSIINSTELAITDVDEGSQTEKDLERVLKAARRGGHVVKQILAFSRPSQQGFAATDLGMVVTEVLQLIEVSLPSKVLIRSHINMDLGSILADPTQLHQVVMNLCTNAFQALPESGGKISVYLDKRDVNQDEANSLGVSSGEFLCIKVEDNGVGLHPDVIDKIFEPFFSLKDKAEGTGLGLAVVHGIVKGHDGSIRVESELGVGTIFEIFLPYIVKSKVQVKREKWGAGMSQGRILFVEDDPEQLVTAPRILRSFGFDVDPVRDPKEAVALVHENPDRFDLVITDYDMPKLNGVEMVQVMSTIAPELPTMIISGREEAITAAAECETVKKVMIKPYQKDEIHDAIISILEEEKIK